MGLGLDTDAVAVAPRGLVERLLALARIACHVGEPRCGFSPQLLLAGEGLFKPGHLVFDLGQIRRMARQEAGQVLGFRAVAGERLLEAGQAAASGVELLFQRFQTGAVRVELLAQNSQRLLDLNRLEGPGLETGLQRGRLVLQRLLQLDETADPFRVRTHPFEKRVVLVDQDPDLERLVLPLELMEALRSARLALKRPELALDLDGQVVQTDEILLGGVEFPQRRRLALLELGNPGCLLEQHPPVLGVCIDQGTDVPLADDGVGLGVEAGVEKQLADVAQPAGRVVDVIFALAGTIESSGDADFGEHVVRNRQLLPGELDGQGDLGHAERMPRLAAGENQVLHFLPAQLLGTLFAEHPADRVRDVALSTTVGSDDRVDSRLEMHLGAVEECLEPVQLELLENQGLSSFAPAWTPRQPTRQ